MRMELISDESGRLRARRSFTSSERLVRGVGKQDGFRFAERLVHGFRFQVGHEDALDGHRLAIEGAGSDSNHWCVGIG